MQSTALIRVEHLVKSFQGQVVLEGLSFEVQKGEILAILGSSGSGKSTLLRCLNRMEEIDSGCIWIAGTLLTEKTERVIRSRVGMVFQQFNLFSHMTALENLCYAPVCLKKLNPVQAQEKATQLLIQVGLRHRLNVYPKTLSGGEKQRVAIARTLMLDPEVILFDEPTSALDPEMVQEVLKVMKNLASSGITMISVTHEVGFVKEVAHRVLFLEQGRLLADQKTEAFFHSSQNPRILAFLNHSS